MTTVLQALREYREARHYRKLAKKNMANEKKWLDCITPKIFKKMRQSGALILIILSVASCDPAPALASDMIDLSIIAKIESSNNPLAYNQRTQATGLYQITPVCLADFRQNCKWGFADYQLANFTMENMFDSYLNFLVAKWYLNERIPQMLKYYNLPDTLENRLTAYNAGIGRVVKGIMPRETKNYILKYKQLSRTK